MFLGVSFNPIVIIYLCFGKQWSEERERERATETFCGRLVQENIEDNPGGGKFLTYMPF